MSGNFSFPPPPPPPPRATSTWEQEISSFDTGSRGSNRTRGRGREHDRGGRGRGNVGHNTHFQGPPNLPPGAYVNPNFQPRSTNPGQQHDHERKGHPSTNYPPRTAAGHKRKLEVLRGPQHNLPNPPVAPVIPTFGTVSPSNNRASTTNTPSLNAFGLIPVERDLHDDSSEVSEEDRDEEALFAELGDKLTFEHNGTVMVLSTAADIAAWQNERKRNWPTKARMEEKDAEKRVIGAERRRLLSVASILNDPMAGMRERKIKQQVTVGDPTLATAKPKNELQSIRQHVVEQTEKLELLRKKVVTSQARLDQQKARQSAEDERLADKLAQPSSIKGVTSEDASDEVLSDSSVVSSDSDDDDTAQQIPQLLKDDDDDGPPEEATSKRPESTSTDLKPLCRYFTASGRCRDGDECRFRHEQGLHHQHSVTKPRPAPKSQTLTSNTQRKGIFQRLAEQEQDENDRLVLQVVKSLGKAGFFE